MTGATQLSATLPRSAADTLLEHARALLAAKPDGVIETVAREAGVTPLAVIGLLAPRERITIDGTRFDEIWREMSDWGEVVFIVHTADIVLECEGSLPVGSFGHGYYNIHGDSPIGGHIKADRCRSVVIVDRAFHGRRSCSVQFYNGEGEAMFKVFVRRNKARELLPNQLARFESLQALHMAGGSPS